MIDPVRRRQLFQQTLDLYEGLGRSPLAVCRHLGLRDTQVSGIRHRLSEARKLGLTPTLTLGSLLPKAAEGAVGPAPMQPPPPAVAVETPKPEKPRFKGRVTTSFEFLLYRQLEDVFADDPRVTFRIPRETDAHFSAYGVRFLLTHGDSLGVKGGDGMIGALGPIARGAIKTYTSESQIGRDFDVLLIGHYHQYRCIPEMGVIANGSLVGYNEYARLQLRARYERPIQALWLVHPKQGVTARWPIFLDERRTSDAPWLTWQGEAA